MTNHNLFFLFISILFFSYCAQPTEPKNKVEESIPEKVENSHIVFVTGDEEYRSEESMPMLAKIAQKELGAKVSVCYALNEDGIIDPNIKDNIVGLEALETADLMVIFTRFRALPDNQLKYILDYVDSGKPIVGFRTSTHAFLYENDLEKGYLNNNWPTEVFGQKWITHHGHFDDGSGHLTEVNLYADQKSHPSLRGVSPFNAYSWLYHVEGNGDQLFGDSQPILTGRSLRSNYAESGDYPMNNPVAWTKTHTSKSGKTSRVFFTTLGHPFDFKETSMRKLSMNGIAWALGKEALIPANGFDVEVNDYEPNNSGFGEKYKKNQKPVVFN